jgi:hypothetical protein
LQQEGPKKQVRILLIIENIEAKLRSDTKSILLIVNPCVYKPTKPRSSNGDLYRAALQQVRIITIIGGTRKIQKTFVKDFAELRNLPRQCVLPNLATKSQLIE